MQKALFSLSINYASLSPEHLWIWGGKWVRESNLKWSKKGLVSLAIPVIFTTAPIGAKVQLDGYRIPEDSCKESAETVLRHR